MMAVLPRVCMSLAIGRAAMLRGTAGSLVLLLAALPAHGQQVPGWQCLRC